MAQSNPVKRIGAFHRAASEKAALETSYRHRVGILSSGQSQAHPLRVTNGFCGNLGLYRGGHTRPLQSLAGWQCRYTHQNATLPILASHLGTAPISIGIKRRGPGLIRPTRRGQLFLVSEMSKDGAVNTNDSASGLIRFTPQESCWCGPNGWGWFA